MDETHLTTDAIAKLSHDLRAPLINIQGFSDELGGAIKAIIALINRHQGDLPADFRSETSKLIEQDLIPCCHFLGSSVTQLVNRIDSIGHGRIG